MDMTTVFLFTDGLNAAWMIVIGSFIIILPFLFILNHVLKKYKDKHLLEVTQLSLGKPLTSIIAFIMLCAIVINVASDSRSYMAQLHTLNFPKTPLFFTTLCFLVFCAWGAKRGWEAMTSTAWMIFPYLITSLALLFFLMQREGTMLRTFPLYGPGQWEIAKASFKYTSIYPEPFLLAMMYPFVKDHRTYTRGLYSSLGFTVLLSAFMYLSYVWLFDYQSLSKISYPFNNAIRLVQLGESITNIETFFITVWLVAVFMKFIIYLYFACKIFGYLFRISEFEQTIIPITALVFLISLIPENNEINVFVIRETMLTYYKYFLLSLPPLLWIGTRIKEARAK